MPIAIRKLIFVSLSLLVTTLFILVLQSAFFSQPQPSHPLVAETSHETGREGLAQVQAQTIRPDSPARPAGTSRQITSQPEANIKPDESSRGIPATAQDAVQSRAAAPVRSADEIIRQVYEESRRRTPPQPVPPTGKQITDATPMEVGTRLLAQWDGKWWEVRVLEVLPGDKLKIHWMGWGTKWDAVEPRSRFQLADAASPALTGPAGSQQESRAVAIGIGHAPTSTATLHPISLEGLALPQGYTAEMIRVLYYTAAGDIKTDGLLAAPERFSADRVLSIVPAVLSKDEYEKLRSLRNQCEMVSSGLYFDCRGNYHSRFEQTLKLETSVRATKDEGTLILWKDIARFGSPFEIDKLVDSWQEDTLEDIKTKFQNDESLTLYDVARIRRTARLYQAYFVASELEHIKISLLELKLANWIPRWWGKCNPPRETRRPGEPGEIDLRPPDSPPLDPDYGDEIVIPLLIETYRGIYTVEDFNDLHLLPDESADEFDQPDGIAGFGESLRKSKRQNLSAAAQLVFERLARLISGQPVEEAGTDMFFTSTVLSARTIRQESPQLREGRYYPRVRPQRYALKGATDTFLEGLGHVDPYPMRLAGGLLRRELEGLIREVSPETPLTSGLHVVAESISDDNPDRWHPAVIKDVQSDGKVQVKYLGFPSRDDELLDRSRLLLVPPAGASSTENPVPSEARLEPGDVLQAERDGEWRKVQVIEVLSDAFVKIHWLGAWEGSEEEILPRAKLQFSFPPIGPDDPPPPRPGERRRGRQAESYSPVELRERERHSELRRGAQAEKESAEEEAYLSRAPRISKDRAAAARARPGSVETGQVTTFKALFEEQFDINYTSRAENASQAARQAINQIVRLEFQKAFSDNTLDLIAWVEYVRGRAPDSRPGQLARRGIEATLSERCVIHANVRPYLPALKARNSGVRLVPVPDRGYQSVRRELSRLLEAPLDSLGIREDGKVVPLDGQDN